MDEAELQSVEEAKAVAAVFASDHDVDERKAQAYAKTWYEQAEGLPERMDGALLRALKRHFGLFELPS